MAWVLAALHVVDSMTLTFSGGDALRVRAALGDEPERRLLEMCGATA